MSERQMWREWTRVMSLGRWQSMAPRTPRRVRRPTRNRSRSWIREVTSVMVPLSFASIPVLGMLWMLAPELPPPGISLVRIGLVLISAVLPLYVVARRWSAASASNTLGLPLLLLALYPS